MADKAGGIGGLSRQPPPTSLRSATSPVQGAEGGKALVSRGLASRAAIYCASGRQSPVGECYARPRLICSSRSFCASSSSRVEAGLARTASAAAITSENAVSPTESPSVSIKASHATEPLVKFSNAARSCQSSSSAMSDVPLTRSTSTASAIVPAARTSLKIVLTKSTMAS